ncbi:MAG: hypothetical protein R6V40_02815 [Candidatus Moraniibacteriota bacterium]
MKKGINLKSEGEAKREKNEKSPMSTVLSTVILLLVLASYGGVFYLKKKTDQDLKKYEKEIKRVAPKLQNENYLEFYNIQRKNFFIKETLDNFGSVPCSQKLRILSEATLPQTVFEKLDLLNKEKGGTAEVGFIAPSREYVADQINSYKKNESISKASLKSVEYEEGSFLADLEINFK